MRAQVLSTALILTSVPAFGQYARRPADTLHFREISSSDVVLDGPRGKTQTKSERAADIALTFRAGDTALVWFESLKIVSGSLTGQRELDTREALRKPFTLRFDARGRTATLATPAFPAAYQGSLDLTHFFDDFFFRLPAVPIAKGASWKDTLSLVRDEGAGKYHATKRGSYRVDRDTTVNGVAALVIVVTQDLELDASQPIPGRSMTVSTKLAGRDTGIIVFAPKPGLFFGRHRKGELNGDVTYEGGGQTMHLTEKMTFENNVTVPPK